MEDFSLWMRGIKDIDLFNFNWKGYTEEQLHKILEIYFDFLGYKVKNLHEADRAAEKGADLLVVKNKETIAIAVKIKPNSNDISQLFQLSKRKEKKKIYYFVETPTEGFSQQKRDKQFKYIKFQTMNDFLKDCFEKTPSLYFELVISNKTYVNEYIKQTVYFFNKAWMLKDSKIKGTTELDKAHWLDLWRMKDIAVELNKSAENLLFFYENKIIKQNDKQVEAKLFIQLLKKFERRLQRLSFYTEHFFNKNESFLTLNARETFGDSDWSYLIANFHTTPEEIDEYFKRFKKMKKAWEPITALKSETKEKFEDIFCYIFRQITVFGGALESRIDNFFHQAIGEPFERDNAKRINRDY